MIPFKFTRVSRQLIGDLTASVVDGESAVLLGPRFCNKRFVMREALRTLEGTTGAIALRLYDIGSSPLAASGDLGDRLTATVRSLGYDPPPTPEEEIFASVDWLQEKTGRRVYLFAADVDGMAHHVARVFLQGIRARVAAGRLVVLLSGEYDFRDLVHGPDSEFNPAKQYFLQGLDEGVFAEFFQSHTGGTGSRIDRPEAVRQRLFELTGGSSYLLRLLIESTREQRARAGEWEKPVTPEDFASHLEWDTRPIAHWTSVLEYPTSVISGVPGCWPDLEALLASGIVEVPLAGGPPGALEFSGIVVRDVARRRLAWASPVQERLARRYYDFRRLADLYAQNGQWKEAFDRYSKLTADERIRPFDFEDKLKSEYAVNSLCASLHVEVELGPAHLRERFSEGCRLLLGFPHVSRWVLDRTWSPVDEKTVLPVQEVARMLPVGETLSEGWLPLPGPFNSYAAAAILATSRPGRYMAVVVGDFDAQRAISRERERLLRKLMSHYVAAHGRAVAIEAARRRLDLRDHQLDIVNSISDTLSRNVLDVRQVLRMAAEGLLRLGYHRVQFCFVDRRRERIKGVVDMNDDPTGVNVADMTDWPLRPPTTDIQPYVAHTKKSMVVPDPSLEPLINPFVLRAAKLRPLAIVPILDRNQTVLGTIHVERGDSLVPIDEEVQDLLFFGRQLAAVIEHSERVRLLHDALDKIPSPVALVDLDCEALYANRPAADLFEASAAWRDASAAPSMPAKWGEGLAADLKECLESGQRIVHHYTGIGTRSDYRGTVLCSKIEDWQGSTAAAVVHVEDLNYLEDVFEAFGGMARSNDTGSACQNLLDVCLQLGAKWARLYLVDDHDPNSLVGKLWVGEGGDQERSEFPKKIEFQRGVDPDFGWLAIDTMTPQVFCYKPEGHEGDRFRTDAGLEAVAVTGIPGNSPKQPGDFWIDLPLCTPDNVLGKVTLDCEPWVLPEKFEMLKVLSDSAASLLGAFALKERMMFEREEYIKRSAAETVMASIAHNLNTRLAALPGMLTLYKMAEGRPSLLPELNRDFQHVLENALGTVARTKDMLAAITLRPQRFDLYEHLDATLRSAQLQASWKLIGDQRPLEVEWDSHHIGSAMLELVRNSQQASDPAIVKIEIASFERNGIDWVRIVCRDRGPGILADLKETIFKDFFSRKSQEHAGTGLGLWYVRRVADAHGGSVQETGTPGAGARFVIELPRRVSNPK